MTTTPNRNAQLDIEIPAGLKGVRVAETAIGDVRGAEGFFHYRQHDATELARTLDLEQVWQVVHDGVDLSDAGDDAFRAAIAPLRALPEGVLAVLREAAQLGEGNSAGATLPMIGLGVQALGAAASMRSWLDIPREQLQDDARRIAAGMATIVAALHRMSQGLDPVAPDPDLSHAANYLYMITGEKPDAAKARALEQYLILTIDHGFNASTFTARVITSTGADCASVISGALGSLSGPLHGGAPSRALAMVDEIGTPENAEPYLRDIITGGGRLMGFGHPVYTTEDPRSRMLKQIAHEINAPRIELAELVENTAVRLLDELKPGRQLRTNVEFYAALVMESVGLPQSLFTPTFAVSRVIGWTAHVLEQAGDDNRIFRPSATYVGPAPQRGSNGSAG